MSSEMARPRALTLADMAAKVVPRTIEVDGEQLTVYLRQLSLRDKLKELGSIHESDEYATESERGTALAEKALYLCLVDESGKRLMTAPEQAGNLGPLAETVAMLAMRVNGLAADDDEEDEGND